MAHVLRPITEVGMLLGRCVPCVKKNASKFKVRRLELDTNLNMYFPKDEYLYAYDPEKLCKTGDIVMIKALSQKMTRLITHKVDKVIYPMGDVTDPITGKLVVAGRYRDYVEKVTEVYGKGKNAFDYSKAPPRGWQEDKKDFTHVETYIKYHDDKKDQPYAV